MINISTNAFIKRQWGFSDLLLTQSAGILNKRYSFQASKIIFVQNFSEKNPFFPNTPAEEQAVAPCGEQGIGTGDGASVLRILQHSQAISCQWCPLWLGGQLYFEQATGAGDLQRAHPNQASPLVYTSQCSNARTRNWQTSLKFF